MIKKKIKVNTKKWSESVFNTYIDFFTYSIGNVILIIIGLKIYLFTMITSLTILFKAEMIGLDIAEIGVKNTFFSILGIASLEIKLITILLLFPFGYNLIVYLKRRFRK